MHPIPKQALGAPLCSFLNIGISSTVSSSPLPLVLSLIVVVSDLQKLWRNVLVGFLPSPKTKIFYSFRPSSSSNLRQTHKVPISHISAVNASHVLPSFLVPSDVCFCLGWLSVCVRLWLLLTFALTLGPLLLLPVLTTETGFSTLRFPGTCYRYSHRADSVYPQSQVKLSGSRASN